MFHPLRALRPACAAIALAAAVSLGSVPATAVPPAGTVTPQPAALSAANPAPAPHYTTNAATCLAHGGDALECADVGDGLVYFYWTYDCGEGCKVDTIGLDRVAAGAAARGPVTGGAMTGAPAPGKTNEFVAKPDAGWANSCYVIVATLERPPGAARSTQAGTPACVAAVSRSVTVPASGVRSWEQEVAVKNGARTSSTTVGNALPVTPGDTSTGVVGDGATFFTRAAFGFDRSSLGNASVLGGRFVYDIEGEIAQKMKLACANVYAPAPAGWQTSATAPAPQGTALGLLGRTDLGPRTVGSAIDAPLRAWQSGAFSVLLVEQPPSEQVPYRFATIDYLCPPIVNPRLILRVGIDV